MDKLRLRQITIEGKPVPTKEEMIASEKFIDKLIVAITGPVITTPTTTQDITVEQKEKARLSRLAQLCKDGAIEEATDYEAMIYLSNFTLEHPPDHTTYKVYSYLFNKLYPEQAKEVFGEQAVTELDIQGEMMLKELKVEIYKSQKNHIKSKGKDKCRKQNSTAKSRRQQEELTALTSVQSAR